MEIIKSLNKVNKNDFAIAGGKGSSLGEMLQAGISVPPGFVILASAFERFIIENSLGTEIDSSLEKVDQNEMHTIEQASESIQALILQAEIPIDIKNGIKESFKDLHTEFVAVRSSATAEDGTEAAWAGQLDTFLNTTEDTLLENVQKCWASLFTPRAIFYRFEKGMGIRKISVAVVVQKMVNSESAGIAFSVHPVTEDRNQMIIEAGFGLGEAIVSGQITPDKYVVTKEPRSIVSKHVSEQARGIYRKVDGGNEWQNLPKDKGSVQVLTDGQILALVEILITIESHYRFPVDIEWAMEGGKFYIVQSRPVTTLSEKLMDTPVYEKFFSRDFCLASVEAWVRGESTNPKQWTTLSQPILPFLIMERSNDTVHSWYDLQGVEWIQNLLAQTAKTDPKFLQELEKEVLRRISYLQPIYDNENEISETELKKFIQELEDGYPWFEAMWWICQMDVAKLENIDVSDMQKLRAHTDKLSSGSDTVIRKSLFKIYPALGELSSVLRTEEILSGKVPSKGVLEKRNQGYFFANNELLVGVTSSDVEQKFNIRFPRDVFDKSTAEITGESAQKGVVRGIVRKVMGHKQIGLIQEGEILVSPMTMPDFLPAMKKAAAFVTDEGGITCHAAIIAREMRKPCITGTKIATQVLNDGDEVEVDADKGIVRILSK